MVFRDFFGKLSVKIQKSRFFIVNVNKRLVFLSEMIYNRCIII